MFSLSFVMNSHVSPRAYGRLIELETLQTGAANHYGAGCSTWMKKGILPWRTAIWWNMAGTPYTSVKAAPEWHPAPLMLSISLTFLFYLFKSPGMFCHLIIVTLLFAGALLVVAAAETSLAIDSFCLYPLPLCYVYSASDNCFNSKWLMVWWCA